MTTVTCFRPGRRSRRGPLMLLVLPVLALLMVVSLAPAPAAGAVAAGVPVAAAAAGSSAAVSPAMAASLAAEAQTEPDGDAAAALLEHVDTLELDWKGAAPGSMVVDPAGKYAYIGGRGSYGSDPSHPPGHVVKLDLDTFKVVDVLRVKSNSDVPGVAWHRFFAAVIDPAGDYAYFGNNHSCGEIFKIDLETFEQVDTLVLHSPGKCDSSSMQWAVLDSAGRFAYFGGHNSYTGRVYKIDLETFERVGAYVVDPAVDGGDASYSGVIDPAGKYGYFGSGTQPWQDPNGAIVKVDLDTMERVGSIALPGERANAAVSDTAGGFAYFGTTSGRLHKVDLATFKLVSTIESGGSLNSAVIDPAAAYAYFGHRTATGGEVLKIDLATFTVAGTAAVERPEIARFPVFGGAAMDPTGAHAYFLTEGGPYPVVKFDLDAFEQVDWMLPAAGDGSVRSAVVDPGGRYAYLGTADVPAKVIKVDLETFEKVDRVVLTDDDGTAANTAITLSSAVIDPQGRFAYFGNAYDGRGKVFKVNLETLDYDVLLLEKGEEGLRSAVIDPQGRYAYFGTDTIPARVVKIDLETFERVGAIKLTLNGALAWSAAIDPEGAYAYFVGGAGVQRIDLETFEQVDSIVLQGVEGSLAATDVSVIDPVGNFLYVGGRLCPTSDRSCSKEGATTAGVAKVDLDAFAWVDTLPLDVAANSDPTQIQPRSAVMDPGGRFAVFAFATYCSTCTVNDGLPASELVRVDLATFEQTHKITPDRAWHPEAAFMDPRGQFAYFATKTYPAGRVYKVRVGDGQVGAVDALAFTGASAFSGVRGATAELSARLTPEQAAPAAGQRLRFTAGGFDAESITDAKGVARVKMPVEQSYGRHELTVSFAGDQGKGLPPAKAKALFYTLWEHTFADGNPRVLVNTITNELQFAAPGDVSGVKHDPNMKVETLPTGEKVIRINYTDLDLTVVGEFFPGSGRFAATVLTPTGPYVLKGAG